MRFRPITARQCRRLPPSCWEEATVAAAEQAWGWCGISAQDTRAIHGYALLCPSHQVPRGHVQSGGPIGQCSATLLHLDLVDADPWSDPLAVDLLRHVLLALGRQRVQGVDVFATTAAPRPDLPPSSWVEAAGFALVRPDRLRPKYRIDSARTLRLPRVARSVWRRLWEPVELPTHPEPASRRTRG